MNAKRREGLERPCRSQGAIVGGRQMAGRRGRMPGRWVIAAVLASLAVVGLKTSGDEPAQKYTISKETTYLTEPLRKDGSVDYVAALNRQCSQGVTPENNAAVLFWKAVGPEEIVPEHRDKFCRMLGIATLPEKGEFFVDFGSFVARQNKAADPTNAKSDEAAEERAWDMLEAGMSRPWSRQEFPVLAEWLVANEKPLALVVEATKRPCFYDPLCAGETCPLIAVPFPVTMEGRDVARALCARAMLRLGEGRVEAAWQDLLACHRLARLVGQGPMVVDALVALAFDGLPCAGDRAVLEHAGLTAGRLAQMRADLDRLPPMPKMADRFDAAERFVYLDCVAVLAREGLDSLAKLTGPLLDSLESTVKLLVRRGATVTVDWDLVLREGNLWHDRIADACRGPTRDKQRKAQSKLADDLRKLQKTAEDAESLDALMRANPSKALSERLSQVMLTVFLPSWEMCVQADDRGTMRWGLHTLAFALAAYRVDHGTYPAKLAELAPKYVLEVPEDVFTGGELHYRLEGKGYVLYSVGPNGKDDGAKGLEDCEGTKNWDEDWDDIVVRMPGLERK